MAKRMAFLGGMLLVTLLAACNGGGEEPQPTPIATPDATPSAPDATGTPATTPNPAPTPSTPTPAPTPTTAPTGNPFSFNDLQEAFEARGMTLTLGAPSADFSGFGVTAFDARLARGDDSIELFLLVYEDREAVKEDWQLTFGQSPAVTEGRIVPDHVSIWWNENIVVVVRASVGDIASDALDAFLALGGGENPPTRIFFKRGNELWSVNPDGSDPLRLASEVLNVYRGSSGGSGTKFMPSHHGDKVAFTGTDGNVWIIDSTGENLKRYSEEALPTDETYYGTSVRISGWSPDGTKIIYSVESVGGLLERERERPEVGHYLVELNTGQRTRIPNLPNFVTWTNDPEKVIFEERHNGDSSIDWYTLDLSTGATAKLTVLPFKCFSVHASVLFDANRLLYSCGNLPQSSNIIIANIDNTDQQVLIKGRWAELQFPVLSPSGDSFTYLHQSPHMSGGIVIIDLHLFNLQTGQKKKLATGCTRAGGWLDNHSVIVVKAESEACIAGDASLYLIDAASGARTTLANDIDFD